MRANKNRIIKITKSKSDGSGSIKTNQNSPVDPPNTTTPTIDIGKKSKAAGGPVPSIMGGPDLPSDVKLPKDMIDAIEKAITDPNDDWNIGGTDGPGDEGQNLPSGVEKMPGSTPPDLEDTEDSRIWSKTRSEAVKDIDDAIAKGQAEARKEAIKKREAKTTAEKDAGGMGGGGTIRDRIEIESLARTDWAQIFKTRLKDYRRTFTKEKPWSRRFGGNAVMRTRIPSRTSEPSALGQVNLVIDTSSSLSYRELEVILSEVNEALQTAEISDLNVILWTDLVYHFKKWKKINSTNFQEVIKDIQENWEGGANEGVYEIYERMMKEGIAKQFTIHFTDGYIKSHVTDKRLNRLFSDAIDPKNMVWGMIFKDRSFSMNVWDDYTKNFPGEIVPIFMDTDKFMR